MAKKIIQCLNRVDMTGRVGTVKATRVADTTIFNFSVKTEYVYANRDGVAVLDTLWIGAVTTAGSILDEKGEKHGVINKNDIVHIEGRLRSNRYTDSTGAERSMVEIMGHRVTVLSQNDEREMIPADAKSGRKR